MKGLNPLLKLVIFGLVLLGIATSSAGLYLSKFLDSPLPITGQDVEFQIQIGQSFSEIVRELEDLEILEQSWPLRLYARLRGMAHRVQAGDYLLQGGTTHRQLLEKFVNGDVRLYSFTIVEGWNQRDLLQAIRSSPYLSGSLDEVGWAAFLREIDALAEHPEGLFLPETYHFPRGTIDRELLRQAHELLRQVLEEEWAGRSTEAPLASPYEALILASIVEKETARADERPRIAGVFARRLDRGMRLQTDPTVIYGIGADFDGNLRRTDLQTDTAYNTYTRNGLPPTPIAMPGRAAIHAALHPAEGDELYFVATGDSDGSHTFSATKAEHDAAVAEYLRRLRRQRSAGQ